MAEVQALRSRAQIQREASDWIARLNADHISDEDRARFEDWRNANASHARAFDEVSATWRHLIQAGELISSVALGQAFSAATQRAIRKSRRVSSVRMGFAVAASLAVVACLAWWWRGTMAPRTLFQTAIGEHATVQLPDGSSLELNSNSRAHVDYTPQLRLIRLDRGEAFFQVARDVRRPFWVVAGNSWVRALGTAFNVDMRSTGVRVTVSEGTVKVASNAPSRTELPSDTQLALASVSVLKAGQQVDLKGAATEVRSLPPPELGRAISWRQGTVYFKEERLGAVVDELNRYTALQIVVEDDDLRDYTIGGTFETNPEGAEALLTTLQDGFGLKVRREGRRAYIKKGR
jgi:transmembrane sensor